MKAARVLFLAIFLSACASYDGFTLKPGAPEAEVRSVMGAPAMEFAQPDGSRDLVYPRGPLGTRTYMATLGADGKLQGVRNVLSDDVFSAIKPGMTQEQVLRLIGPPRDKEHFARTSQTAWDWKYVDTWGYQSIFSVMFADADGRVVSKFTRRLDKPSLL
jgi:SmpA/OmlA family protein